MEEREEALREYVREDLRDRGVDCPACDCEEFEIEVWAVGNGIRGEEVRASAVCASCSARLNVSVDDGVFDEIL